MDVTDAETPLIVGGKVPGIERLEDVELTALLPNVEYITFEASV